MSYLFLFCVREFVFVRTNSLNCSKLKKKNSNKFFKIIGFWVVKCPQKYIFPINIVTSISKISELWTMNMVSDVTKIFQQGKKCYQGEWNTNILAIYSWTLKRDVPQAKYKKSLISTLWFKLTDVNKLNKTNYFTKVWIFNFVLQKNLSIAKKCY